MKNSMPQLPWWMTNHSLVPSRASWLIEPKDAAYASFACGTSSSIATGNSPL
jgi:hypothetical protein